MEYPERIVAMFKKLQTLEDQHWDKLSAEYIEYGEYAGNYKPDDRMVDLANRIEEECYTYEHETGQYRNPNEDWYDKLYMQVHKQ